VRYTAYLKGEVEIMKYSVPHHRRRWPGVLMALFLVAGLTVGVLWRSEKLLTVALGASHPKAVKTSEPSPTDRDLLNLIIEKEVGNGHH
jgi:hypothetical protein